MTVLSSDAASAMTEREALRYSLLVRIGTATPLRIWGGIGDFVTDSDDELDPSATYLGVGILGNVPAMRQLIGGVAERLDFTFSGVDSETQAWLDSGSDIDGAEVNVGVVFFDDDWSTVAPTAWMWTGIADVASLNYANGKKTVTLSVVSEFFDRQRASLTMWTNAAHQALSPGDRFFDRIARMNLTTSAKW